MLKCTFRQDFQNHEICRLYIKKIYLVFCLRCVRCVCVQRSAFLGFISEMKTYFDKILTLDVPVVFDILKSSKFSWAMMLT